ncbi:TPA: recombinase family protein [Escherichia coli]|uniref:recombinase family protein n=1 Tax=Cronobacter muytjensii TaxID=413501 RepID=UPI00126E51E4|nr:recombinase family protein [Cronobacter muytjensii]EAM5005937.1 resolvase [Salmonella enterica]EFG2528762.1 recombinase family protein [Escherichia coli]EAT8674944.1 resolvase [Salmonella enterica]EEC2753749.1 resolvase [Salmonella enterica]NUW61640.1 recombinase family protein [Cronobacter muytjensii]
MNVARIYLRVSTDEQELTRQNSIIEDARKRGFYVAGVYKEKASGARADRPELQRMIHDLQPGEVVIAEHIDRISRLPLDSALALINSIKERGAKLAIPGIVDLTELANAQSGVAKVVLESVQDMLLKVALQLARDDYENRRKRQKEGIEIAKRKGRFQGRVADVRLHKRIIEYRSRNTSIAETAKLCECSATLVKSVWAKHKKNKALKGEE